MKIAEAIRILEETKGGLIDGYYQLFNHNNEILFQLRWCCSRSDDCICNFVGLVGNGCKKVVQARISRSERRKPVLW